MSPNSTDSNPDDFCVNDLLYFVNFKRKTTAVNDVVSTCEAFYTPDAILSAKRKFFDVVGEHEGIKFSSRRGPNPSKSNLEDLVNAMHKCDNDGIPSPKFCSADLSNVPQNNDGNVSLNQLLFIIAEMKTQLSNLEKKSTRECRCLKTPSTPSSAVELAPSDASSPPIDSSSTSDDFSSPELTANSVTDSTSESTKSSFASIANITARSAPPTTNLITPHALEKALKVALPPTTVANKNAGQKRTVESRIKTNHERNKNIVIGKKPSSGAMSWGGAPLTVDCYVGRVDFSVTAEQIKSDVVAMGVDVLEIAENQTRHQLFKSFKLVVKKTDFSTLNSPEIWPEGVVFRRFRRPRPPIPGQVESPVTN